MAREKFKIGDRVRLTEEAKSRIGLSFWDGDLYIIEESASARYDWRVVPVGKGHEYYLPFTEKELLPIEEPYVFKEGDRVHIHKGSHVDLPVFADGKFGTIKEALEGHCVVLIDDSPAIGRIIFFDELELVEPKSVEEEKVEEHVPDIVVSYYLVEKYRFSTATHRVHLKDGVVVIGEKNNRPSLYLTQVEFTKVEIV